MLSYATRRKVFISFCQRDREEVDAFIDKWAVQEGVFIPKALGVSDNDDFIDSDDPEYVMSRIRAKYLQDSSVTIVLVGACTHSRRYVDWELKASFRRGEVLPNGVMAVLLPSYADGGFLPPRLKDNWREGNAECYARYWAAPSSAEVLAGLIEDAYDARTSRAHLIKNGREMMKHNAKCRVCGITH